jgi:hypothetical protein
MLPIMKASRNHRAGYIYLEKKFNKYKKWRSNIFEHSSHVLDEIRQHSKHNILLEENVMKYYFNSANWDYYLSHKNYN